MIIKHIINFLVMCKHSRSTYNISVGLGFTCTFVVVNYVMLCACAFIM